MPTTSARDRKWIKPGKATPLIQKGLSGRITQPDVFEAHSVDSWVLAHLVVGGLPQPDHRQIWFVMPLRVHPVARETPAFMPGRDSAAATSCLPHLLS